MTAPISQTAFRGPRDIFVGGALAQLRLATRLPLRVSCQCRAHWDAPALDQLRFERDVELGTFGDLASAMAKAATSVASGLIAADRDPDLRMVPQFVTVLDADHYLVLAGEVKADGIAWYTPVASDAEARSVVSEACHLRSEARAAVGAGNPTGADALIVRARALEGRLVDPFWRDLARSLMGHAHAI
ncbi:hypothetical protein D2N39_20440 [Gemmobacter lutimaris]|jgi:hypothetical protein|uniref:Uncharacterized protein n=2 Tax=Gemmobacter TaxID=204456 RepID=A0A398BLU3_9RHOB|nr:MULTISPECIES: hypothetical protein [Gemmobacter]RID89941.1 hypothetical protein D2N39_20440 [Gemmobacter lutimaris]GHC40242.1 hypothetical protein GCM10007291_47580 [Gemmobacter nanjingensis]